MFRRVPLLVVFSVLLGGCSFSLAQDVTPPPNYSPPATFSPQTLDTPAPEDFTATPVTLPDIAKGQAIYLEKCAPCHGESGMSDSPQATDLPVAPPKLGDPEVARAATPIEWFQIVTNGNMQRMMPPFRDALDDAQRWDVVAYAMMLHVDAQALNEAKQIYQQQCANCHGVEGKGDGQQAKTAGTRMPNWHEPGRLISRSNQALFTIISAGKSPDMPAYANSLSEEQRWALAAFVRSLSFTGDMSVLDQNRVKAPQAKTEATSEALSNSSEVAGVRGARIEGQASMVDGSPAPGGLPVYLRGFEGMQLVFQQETVLDEEGKFRFEGLDVKPGWVLMASVEYQGLVFSSDHVRSESLQGGDPVVLPVTLYETTSDISSLVAERLHVFFNFSDPGFIQVAELFVIGNPEPRVVMPSGTEEILLRFKLPPGASDVQYRSEDEQDYLVTGEEVAYRGMIPPAPARQQILFAYRLPYQRKLELELISPLLVKGIEMALPANGVEVKSKQLEAGKLQEVSGITVKMYHGGQLPAGSPLAMTISGWPGTGGVALGQSSTSQLLLGAGALAIALGLALFWYFHRRDEVQPVHVESEPQTVEAVLDAILALDDRFRAGELNETAYRQRRAELKARLRELKHE